MILELVEFNVFISDLDDEVKLSPNEFQGMLSEAWGLISHTVEPQLSSTKGLGDWADRNLKTFNGMHNSPGTMMDTNSVCSL